jgi:YVTN family beta-propeller protein
LAVDETNSQIVVANSNVDIFFSTGSLGVLTVDTSDPSTPSLALSQVIEAPNFAGQMYFDDANDSLYVPFRQATETEDDLDQIRSYSLTAAGLTLVATGSVEPNPFGITGNAGSLYVVSNDILNVLDTSLGAITTIDLTTAADAEIEDSNSEHVEDVVIDAARNRAYVSNAGGTFFVVDLASNAITAAISGPESTRDLILDGDTLYALDPTTELVWIFDVSEFTLPSSTPSSVDDSTFLLGVVSVGTNPSCMALDSTDGRLYVANSSDNTISVIDTVIQDEIARISVDPEDLTTFERSGDFPYALALGTFGGTKYLFVTGFNDNSVVMIRTQTHSVVEVFPDNTL